MAMTPQEAWTFTNKLSSSPGPGGQPSELQKAAEGAYVNLGLATVYPMTLMSQNQHVQEAISAAQQKEQARQEAQSQGLPYPPEASILEKVIAEERMAQQQGQMGQGQMDPNQMAQGQMGQGQMPPQGMPLQGQMPPQGMPPQGMPPGPQMANAAAGGLIGLQDGGRLFGLANGGQAQGYADPYTLEEFERAIREQYPSYGRDGGVERDEPWHVEAARDLWDTPYIGKGMEWITGAESVDELGEKPLPETLARTALGLWPGYWGARAVGKVGSMALPHLARRGATLASQKGWKGAVGRWAQPRGPRPLTSGADRAARVRAGVAGGITHPLLTGSALFGGLGMTAFPGARPWNWAGEDGEDGEGEGRDETGEEWIRRMMGGAEYLGEGDRRIGDGIGADLPGGASPYDELVADLETYETDLKKETPEEEAARTHRELQAQAIEARIDPERNSRERKSLLFETLAAGVLGGRGPGGIAKGIMETGGIGALRDMRRGQEQQDFEYQMAADTLREQSLAETAARSRIDTTPQQIALKQAAIGHGLEVQKLLADIAMNEQSIRFGILKDLPDMTQLQYQLAQVQAAYDEQQMSPEARDAAYASINQQMYQLQELESLKIAAFSSHFGLGGGEGAFSGEGIAPGGIGDLGSPGVSSGGTSATNRALLEAARSGQI